MQDFHFYKSLEDSERTSHKTSKKSTVDMAPGGIRPRPPKRVHAEQPTNSRVTRSNKRLVQDVDASDIHKPTASASVVRASQDGETFHNFDDHTQRGVEGKFLTMLSLIPL